MHKLIHPFVMSPTPNLMVVATLLAQSQEVVV